MRYPTRASPAGCSVSVLGLLGLVLAGLSLYAAYLLARASQFHDAIFWGIGGVLGLVISAVMVRVGWRMAMAADMSDPYDQDKPTTRF